MVRKSTRSVEITVETDELLIIKEQRGRAVTWCTACAGEARMLRPEAAATLWGTSVREIYRRVEAGQLHSVERPGGLLLVCVNSLV